MGYKKRGHGPDHSRDKGAFLAIPCAVLDSAAYQRIGYPARALLIEIDRQYTGLNNGRLLASLPYLKGRGWNSNDVITRALRELEGAGLIHKTAQGHRPNKASWYAVTWRHLDPHDGYDVGARESFERSAYRDKTPLKAVRPGTVDKAERRQALYKKWPLKNASLTPSPGAGDASIAPSPGVEAAHTAPSPGAIEANFHISPAPSPGDHLEGTISPHGGSVAGVPTGLARGRRRVATNHEITSMEN